jgi:RHS repeat-associated protein
MFGYCGNLGHPTDPENGLIYMRARFYEPWTGRFLSEDPARDGSQFYIFADNAPTANVDSTGKSSESVWRGSHHMAAAFWFLIGVGFASGVGKASSPEAAQLAPFQVGRPLAVICLVLSSFHSTQAISEMPNAYQDLAKYLEFSKEYFFAFLAVTAILSLRPQSRANLNIAVAAAAFYAVVLLGLLIQIDVDSSR